MQLVYSKKMYFFAKIFQLHKFKMFKNINPIVYNMVMKKLSIFIIFTLANLICYSQLNQRLSLKNAVSIGLKNNYQIQISESDIEISNNNNTWGKAGGLPTLSVGVNQANRFDNSESQITDGRDDIYSNSISPYANLQMVIFNGFAITINKQNLEKLQELSKGYMQLTIENTISEIKNSYYSVLLENEKLKVVRELMLLSKDRYDYMLIKQELGTAVTYDVLQIKNSFLTDSSNYLLQKIVYDNSMRQLGKVLGNNIFIRYELTGDLSFEDKDYILGDLITQLTDRNSTLQNLNISQEMLKNNIELAKSSLYPSLVLNAGADYSKQRRKYNDLESQSSYSYDMYANLSLSYTIFNGGNRNRNIANAKIEADKGLLQIKDLELTLKNTLFSLYEMYEVRRQLLRVASENLEAAKLNLEISKDKFNSGAINSFNYRDVQIIYLNTAFSELQAKYNLISTHIDLMKITGNTVQ